MERKLTKHEFVELFTLQRQRTKKARRDIDRQDKTKTTVIFIGKKSTIAYGTVKVAMQINQ